MKRRRIDTNEKPARQFDALRNIRGMTNAARRQVVAAYTTTATGRGARAASRAQHVFPHSRESLRSMRLPTEPGSEDLEVCLKDHLLRFFLPDPCLEHFLELLSAFWMPARFLGIKNCMFTFWEVDPL